MDELPDLVAEILERPERLDELEPDELIQLKRSIPAAAARCSDDPVGAALRAHLEAMKRRVVHHLAGADPRLALLDAVQTLRRVGRPVTPSVWAELIKLQVAAKARARALPINELDCWIPTSLELAIEFKPGSEPVRSEPLELAAASNHHNGADWSTELIRDILDLARSGLGRPKIVEQVKTKAEQLKTKEYLNGHAPDHVARMVLAMVNERGPAERDIRLAELAKELAKHPRLITIEDLRSAL